MKVWSRLEHTIDLDESECWDFTPPDSNVTIAVEQIHIERFGGDPNPYLIQFLGRRRLIKGGLSVRDPQYVCGTVDDIPKNLWLKLGTAKVLLPFRLGPVVVP